MANLITKNPIATNPIAANPITALVVEVRGETAPPERCDMKKAGVKQIGNPHRKQARGKDSA